MLGMNDMFADMVKKIIPQEVQELLTAEKLKEIGDRANGFIEHINATLARIELQNDTAYERQTRILEGIAELKELANGEPGSTGRSSGGRRRRNNGDSSDNSGKSIANGTGSGTN